jgi:uncharacterized protein YeaO (DUF488 family)
MVASKAGLQPHEEALTKKVLMSPRGVRHRRPDRHRPHPRAAHVMGLKRAYDPATRGDGRRILVERLWPRGVKKEALAADAWMKDVAPSTALRKWFDHRVDRWEEFQRRYRKELDANAEAWEPIVEASRRGKVTLLYSAHDTVHNGALVLRDYLAEKAIEPGRTRRAQRHAPAKGRIA